MVFFFGVAAKEITESVLPGGALNPFPRAINPLMGTLGGVFGPVGVFFLLAILFYGGSDDFGAVANGWAIPTATDIALAWLVARVIFGNRHPAVNFLLLLAVADDAIGLVIIAVFYSTQVHPLWLLLTAGGMATAFAFRRLGVTWWPVYILIAGGMSWVGLVKAGSGAGAGPGGHSPLPARPARSGARKARNQRITATMTPKRIPLPMNQRPAGTIIRRAPWTSSSINSNCRSISACSSSPGPTLAWNWATSIP